MKITVKETGQARRKWIEETLALLGHGWREGEPVYLDGGATVHLVSDTIDVEAHWKLESPKKVADRVKEEEANA